MEALTKILEAIDGVVWGVPLIVLIMGTGIYLTIRLGLLQFRKLGIAERSKALNRIQHELFHVRIIHIGQVSVDVFDHLTAVGGTVNAHQIHFFYGKNFRFMGWAPFLIIPVCCV